MKLDRVQIGIRIKSKIIASGKTQKEVAAIAGIGQDTLSDMVNGSKATLESICAVAEVLDCSVDYFLGNIDHSKHNIDYISEYTGLTEKSIQKLHESYLYTHLPGITVPWADLKEDEIEILRSFRTDYYILPLVNTIIENENFLSALWEIKENNLGEEFEYIIDSFIAAYKKELEQSEKDHKNIMKAMIGEGIIDRSRSYLNHLDNLKEIARENSRHAYSDRLSKYVDDLLNDGRLDNFLKVSNFERLS